MDIKKQFEKLSTFQKIEIYLLVIIFYSAVIYYQDILFPQESHAQIIPKNPYQKKIKQIQSTMVQKDINSIIKLIDEKSFKLKVQLISINRKKDSLILKFDGNFINTLNYTRFLSQHFQIDNFSLKQEKKKIVYDMTIKTKYFYNPKMKYNFDKNIPNPFNAKIYKSNDQFLLQAIIGKNVSINSNWYTIGDMINRYIIKQINIDSVILTDTKDRSKLILRLYDDK